MIDEILQTIYYLALVLVGLPTIFLFASSSPPNELKKRALKIYPISLFLILFIAVLIYGVDKTKNAIGNAFGDFIFFVFYAALGFILIVIMIIGTIYILNIDVFFDKIKQITRRLKKSKK